MMLLSPSVRFTRGQEVLNTMRRADRRLLRVVTLLGVIGMVLSLAVAAAIPPCTGVGQAINGGLDQLSLVLFAMLPVLYYSGKKAQ